MSVNLTTAWNNSNQAIEDQVAVFNQKMQDSLSTEEVTKIYETIKLELTRWKEQDKIRDTKINTNPPCCGSTVKAVWIVAILNAASKFCTVAGGTVAAFGPSSLNRSLGLTLVIAGEAFDAATTIYSTKVTLVENEKSEWALLNRQGLENAEVFKKFLGRFKKIRQTELAEKLNLMDGLIQKCMKQYNSLPANYRPDETYSHLVSDLVLQLPEKDSLRKELEDLDKKNSPINVGKLAQDPTQVHYFTPEPTSADSKEEPKAKKWLAEEQPFSPIPSPSEPSLKEELPLQSELNYNQESEVIQYLHHFATRFKVNYLPSFIVTPNGTKIKEE